jgi:hypothetical protein
MTINELKQAIANEKPRSAWGRGVKEYAEGLAEDLEEAIWYGYYAEDKLTDLEALKERMINGADNWSQYSWGGCSFIYDSDIAERLCSPSELKKVKGGDRRPNSREEWLDVQARALSQAANMIVRLAKRA